DFKQLNTRLISQPGEGLTIPSANSTWAIYWSAWQYLFTCDTERRSIDLFNGKPDKQGFGLFARAGIDDKDTNPIQYAVSGGIGGRGFFPFRDNHSFGIAYYYNRLERTRFANALALRDSAQGFECFYNIALTTACHLTLDLQVVKSISSSVDTATILGA